MSTTSRRLSARTKHSRNNHTPGRDKGGNCVRPKDFGLAKLDPSKLRGNRLAQFERLWTKYNAVNK